MFPTLIVTFGAALAMAAATPITTTTAAMASALILCLRIRVNVLSLFPFNSSLSAKLRNQTNQPFPISFSSCCASSYTQP